MGCSTPSCRSHHLRRQLGSCGHDLEFCSRPRDGRLVDVTHGLTTRICSINYTNKTSSTAATTNKTSFTKLRYDIRIFCTALHCFAPGSMSVWWIRSGQERSHQQRWPIGVIGSIEYLESVGQDLLGLTRAVRLGWSGSWIYRVTYLGVE